MITKSNAAKNVVLALILVLGANLNACSNGDGLPKVNLENCENFIDHLEDAAGQEQIKELGLSGDENEINRQIFAAQCALFYADEIKKTGDIGMGFKLEGAEKEELIKELDKEIIKIKEVIADLQAKKKAAQ